MRATTVVALAAAVAPALAGPFFTAPVASTVCTAGQACTISWQDDGKAPTLADFGDSTIGVYAGSQQQQSLMQAVAPANAQTTGTITFVPDPNMGENSGAYFIKMISTKATDPAMPQYPATAYSAMFTLNGMTGKFNATVQAQIAGSAASSGAATGAATTAAGSSSAAAGSSASATRAASSSSSARASSTASGSAASASATSNSASSVVAGGMGIFGATVLAALAAIF
ncbi:hypothetical protein CTheo_6191 [Ceratobasidium theobromae]|uniref:Yeast cell wall synthesis Kre9/Knh1-like N-terminal domain-containing protein n=1 Tax=Ceratobasidium theobromae TaxID=1582974 RepID=A0A5N5QF31_9AGAM|nr:hypothetical protein CTheo_6191 [Ceratobasidium theobromae]